jgi:hypothetical protein
VLVKICAEHSSDFAKKKPLCNPFPTKLLQLEVQYCSCCTYHSGAQCNYARTHNLTCLFSPARPSVCLHLRVAPWSDAGRPESRPASVIWSECAWKAADRSVMGSKLELHIYLCACDNLQQQWPRAWTAPEQRQAAAAFNSWCVARYYPS